MGKGGMTRVIEQRKQGGWTVQIRKHKTTGGITVLITGPGILSATLPAEAAFDLTELLDDTCDSIEDGVTEADSIGTLEDRVRDLGL